MPLTRIDSETALNLDAIASIKFSGDADGLGATVKFLNSGPSSQGSAGETFSGAAARNLYEIVSGGQPTHSQAEMGEPGVLHLRSEFARSKAWYHVTFSNGRRYFVAFVNAKGSCSMRTFDADAGTFLNKKYSAGNYQTQFADVIKDATELTVNSQPNLERDCKERLPAPVLSYLQKQIQ